MNGPILRILTIKLVAMAMFLEPLEKWARSVIYDQIATIWWKSGENRSSRSWDLFAQRIIKNK